MGEARGEGERGSEVRHDGGSGVEVGSWRGSRREAGGDFQVTDEGSTRGRVGMWEGTVGGGWGKGDEWWGGAGKSVRKAREIRCSASSKFRKTERGNRVLDGALPVLGTCWCVRVFILGYFN